MARGDVMKIAFFGSSLVSSYWNGAATYYRGILKALAGLGHHITFYEPDAFDRQQHRDIPDPPWAEVVVYPAVSDAWHMALARAARDCDLLVKASGVGVFDLELERAVPEICPFRAISAYWDVDAPATLDAVAADPTHHLRDAIPRYDLVLTYGGGEPVIHGYERLGARRCVQIYNALDPGTHFAVAPQARFSCDLGFVGNRLPDRETRIDEFFLRPAALLPERRFLLGGAGWDDKSVPPNVRKIGHVGTADHNAFFCSGIATLNVNRISMARCGYSPPTRVFEAAGASACLITDAWQGIEQFLEPDREVLVAANGDEVAAHLAALTLQRARQIANAATARILSHHTYADRARQVNDVLDATTMKSEAAE
jgi:spore maturation protein CgeB